MTRYRKKSRRIKKAGFNRSGSGRPRIKSVSDVGTLRRTRSKSKIKAFIRRNFKILAIAVFVVIVGGLSLILILGGKDKAASNEQALDSSAATPPEAQDVAEFDEDAEYSYEGVDESILEGMAGTDDSMFSDADAELADALFAEEGIRIGVTIGNIITKNDELLLSKLEEVSNIAETQKQVYEVYYYNAGGDYNQQLQDVRSLIKNEVDVIIIGSTNEESFNMVTSMASTEGIPVVAYDAPVSTGYVMNVVTDQTAWGEKYGNFMAQKLTAGNVVQILDDDENECDTQRNNAIQNVLAKNTEIITTVKNYPEWRKSEANDALAAILAEIGQIDGLLTEEGMAQGIIEAYIDKAKKIDDLANAQNILPKAMCADATAGFIKIWYALKNEGVDITPEPEEDTETDEQTPKVMYTAGFGEFVVCAQPKPVGIGAAAFEIALKIAQGYELKPGVSSTYEFTVSTFITDYNLAEYYEQVKDQKDDYVISEKISEQDILALFDPPEEETD